jgi:uncharacterized protein
MRAVSDVLASGRCCSCLATYAAAVFLTGSLRPAVGLHWGWNYGNAVVDALLAVTARPIAETRVLAIASHMLLLGLTVTFVAVQRRRQVT